LASTPTNNREMFDSRSRKMYFSRI